MKKMLWLNKFPPFDQLVELFTNRSFLIEYKSSPQEVLEDTLRFDIIISGLRFSSGFDNDTVNGLDFYHNLRLSNLPIPFILYSSLKPSPGQLTLARKDPLFAYIDKNLKFDSFDFHIQNFSQIIDKLRL